MEQTQVGLESNKGWDIHKILAYLALGIWALIFFDGLFPNIQMFITNGRIVLPNIFLKIVFLIITVLAFVLKPKLPKKQIILAWGLFVLYLVFEVVYFHFLKGFSLFTILFGYNAYYFYLLLMPFLFTFSEFIKGKHIIAMLLVIWMINAVIAFMQHYFNATILPPKSCDGYFEVLVYNFYGYCRSFGLFQNAWNNAFFLIFISIVSFFYLLTPKSLYKKVVFILIILFSGFLIYWSYTRTAYLVAFAVLCNFVLLLVLANKEKLRDKIRYLPIGNLILAVFLWIAIFFFDYKRANKQNIYSYGLCTNSSL